MDDKLANAYRDEALAGRSMIDCYISEEREGWRPTGLTPRADELDWIHARALSEDVERDIAKWRAL